MQSALMGKAKKHKLKTVRPHSGTRPGSKTVTPYQAKTLKSFASLNTSLRKSGVLTRKGSEMRLEYD